MTYNVFGGTLHLAQLNSTQLWQATNKLVSAVAVGLHDARPITGTLSADPTVTDQAQLLFAAPASSIRHRCNKQPTLVLIDLLTAVTKSAAVTKFSKSSILDSPGEIPLFLGIIKLPYNSV